MIKNYLTELVGTFFLVLTIAMSGDPVAIGAVLMALVYMGGPVSGAHYNPAVSLAVYLRGKIGGWHAFMYSIYQIAGAFLAAFVFHVISGGMVFMPAPGTEAPMMHALLVEGLFTFALCSVILHVATSPRSQGNSYFGLAIGFTVLAAATAGGGISGGAFNPAVGIGPALVALKGAQDVSHVWLYLAGPLAGGVLAALFFKLTHPDE